MADRFDEELFLGYIEGDLTHDQAVEFEKLLVHDARLRNLVAHLVIDRSRVRRLPTEEAPAELMERVHQQLERRMLLGPATDTHTTAPARRLRLNRYLAYVALAAMIAVAGLLVLQTISNPDVRHLATAPQARRPSPSTVFDQPRANPDDRLADAEPPRDALELRDGALALKNNHDELTMPAPSSAAPASEGQKDGEIPAHGLGMDAGRTTPGISEADALAKAFKPTTPSPAAAASPSPSSPLAANTAATETPTATTPPRESAFKEKDVPLPPQAPRQVIESSDLRLETTFTSIDAGEREIRAWAFRHDAQVLDTPAANAAGKLEGEDQPSTPRRLILALPIRQIADLVAFLKTQRGQSAMVTRSVDSLTMTFSSQARRDNVETQAGGATTTQPAGEAGGAKTAADPAVAHRRIEVPAESISTPDTAEMILHLEVEIQQRDTSR